MPKHRLIDKAEAREQIDQWLESVGAVYLGKGFSSYYELLACLEDCKPVDLEKHGRWIENTDDFTPAKRCSRCGYNKPIIAGRGVLRQEPDNYCPCCGARMDGGRKEGDGE